MSDEPSPQPAKFKLSTYRKLILDPAISNGAFRVWHYLRDRQDQNGQAWPLLRDIAKDLACKTHSVTKWTTELTAAGYLKVEKVGQKHNHLYTILQGDNHEVVYPKWATPNNSGVAHKGDTKTVSCSPLGNLVWPKGATPRVAHKGYVSNNSIVIPLSKGEGTPKVNQKFIKPTLEELQAEFVKVGGSSSEAQRFLNHYESNGWKVGPNPMQSWPHAVGNWMLKARGQKYNVPGLPEQGKSLMEKLIDEI